MLKSIAVGLDLVLISHKHCIKEDASSARLELELHTCSLYHYDVLPKIEP